MDLEEKIELCTYFHEQQQRPRYDTNDTVSSLLTNIRKYGWDVATSPEAANSLSNPDWLKNWQSLSFIPDKELLSFTSDKDAAKKDHSFQKQSSLETTKPNYSMTKLFLGIAIAVLWQVWYIWSLNSTITEENVESMIQRYIEDRYGPLFKDSLKEEVDEFRPSDLNDLEFEICNMKETVEHLETTVKNLETKHNDLHGLVENTASKLNTLELIINTLKETNVNTATQKLQTKHNELRGSIENTATNLNDLELNINTLKETVTQVDTSIKVLLTKHDELYGSIGTTASNLNNLESNINTFNETVVHVDTATQELQTKHDELHSLVENEKENVKNLLSQEQDLKERIQNNLEYDEKTIRTVQVEAIRTLDEKVTQVKSSAKGLNKSMSALHERVSTISDTSKETVNLFKQLKTDQLSIKHDHELKMKEFTALKQNLESTKAYLNEKLESAEESVTSLSISLNVLDSRLKQQQSLKEAVEILQSKYEKKIEPNLFNKGQLLVAFMLLVLLVLMTMVSQYRLYQRIRGAGLIQGGRPQN